jgi:hypothetical protein
VELSTRHKTKKNMLKLALYEANAETKKMSAFMVGMIGCVEIRETNHGKDAGGIDSCSYVAVFDDGQEIPINRPKLVSDLS